MPKLQITEYANLATDHSKNPAMCPKEPPEADYSIEIGLRSGVSRPFSPRTTFVMLRAETACCLAFGQNPQATPDLQRIEAGETAFRGIEPDHCLAVISAEAEGE